MTSAISLMIRLHYSNRADRLVAALASRIDEERREGGLLRPVTVLVPHAATAAYLKQALAESTGLMANLAFGYLRSFLADAVTGVRVLNAGTFELLLLEALGDQALLAAPELSPVSSYLDAAGGDPLAKDLRRSQLARELARLYDEYVLTRADVLAAWRAGEAVLGLEESVAGFEQKLWQELERRAGPTARTLATAFEADATLTLPRRVHLFQVAVGAPTIQRALARIGAECQLEIYALNPCREFWEDLPSPGQKSGRWPRRRGKEALGDDPFGLVDLADPPALRLWGRPKRETIRLYNGLTDCDFEARFAEPAAKVDTVLGRLQRDILDRAGEQERRRDPPGLDGSLKILACPGIRREAEVIAAEIWRLLDAHPGLRFHQIAVALPARDEDLYRAHLSAAFSEAHQIPHHQLEVPLVGSSPFVFALELLLDLPYSRYTRQDLLLLLTHPLVLACAEGASATEWTQWCEGLSLLHGADHGDHQQTYIEKDLYNWDQGLFRLALGLWKTGERDGEALPYDDGHGRYLPFNVPFDRLKSAGDLVGLCRSLLADARFLRSGERPLAEWLDAVRVSIATYLRPQNDDDERDRQRCLEALEDLTPEVSAQARMSFRIAADLIRARLARLTRNTGQPLADGVVIGPLSVLHDLPFRVAFVPGLGEGRFPSADRRSQLDLRATPRRPGDVTAKDRDQDWFLGRILQTSEALRLSYVSRDATSGDDLDPASVLLELTYLLATDYGLPRPELIEHQPRSRWLADDPFGSPAAQNERQILALRDTLVDHLDGARLPTTTELTGVDEPRLFPRLRLYPLAPMAQVDNRVLPYSALRAFLENPAEGWARYVLRLLDEAEDDPFAQVDEHFTTVEPARSMMLEAAFLEGLRSGGVAGVEAAHRRLAERLELAGVAPTGVFLEAESRRHLEILGGWHKAYLKAFGGRPPPLLALTFGPARDRHQLTETTSALTIGDVEVRGHTQALSTGPSASIILRSDSIDRAPRVHRAELRAYLDQLVLAALGLRCEEHRGFLLFPEGLHTVAFAAIAKEEAEAELAVFTSDLFGGAHDYRLDFGTIVAIDEAGGKKREVEQALRRSRPAAWTPFSSRLEPPSAEEAIRIWERRYRSFFRRRKGPEGK